MTLTLEGPLLLTPSTRDYAWGDSTFIPELLGLPRGTGPLAEAWFGAHPLAPARVHLQGHQLPLDGVLREHGAAILGPDIQREFGELPYLLKLLSARVPLSIQVHPSRDQAEAGFLREEAAGLPRDAPARSYRDRNHKPELLVALTEFHALGGFRPVADIARALDALPRIRELLPDFEPGPVGLRRLIGAYFELPSARVERAWALELSRLTERNERAAFSTREPEHWALLAHRELSRGGAPDRGLLFVFLLALVRLEPGQGVFLPAGVPHAYLRGAGIELMASSDNVLRAGLTPKHVDVSELMKVVRFDSGQLDVLAPSEDQSGVEARYATPATEFELRRLRLDERRAFERVAVGPETLLALPDSSDSAVTIAYEGGQMSLARGGACLIPHGVRYRLESEAATVTLARVAGGERAAEFRGREPTRLAFGTSGLRGLVTDITDLEAYVNTRGFLEHCIASGDSVSGTTVALAGDLRASTDRILRAVAAATTDLGLVPEYCGKLPTPALMAHGLARGCPSVMVTGSHIPFDRNGIKFNKRSGEVLKSDEAPILAAVERVRCREYARARASSPFDDVGGYAPGRAAKVPEIRDEARHAYVRRLLDVVPGGALSGQRILVYEHSAVGRELLAEVLAALGAEVHAVGRSESFVPVDTEAISDESLRLLQSMADDARARLGRVDAIVSTDGDSDRPLLVGVEPHGRVRFFGGDQLGIVVASYLDADAIAVPVSATDAIERYFTARGVPVVRTRIGSPWVIAAMAELEGERKVGWEANGGFLTGSDITLERGTLRALPTRDAMLPIVAALHAARLAKCSLVELFAKLPPRFGQSALLDHVSAERSRALLARLGPDQASVRSLHFDAGVVTWTGHDGVRHPAEGPLAARSAELEAVIARHFGPERGFGALEEIDYLDGTRLRFAGGDVAHVRPSGNAPQLRIYALADSAERAARIVDMALQTPSGILPALLSE